MATASVVPSGGTTSLLLEREVQVAALRALITAGLIQAYPRRALLADRPPPRRQESQRANLGSNFRARPGHPPAGGMKLGPSSAWMALSWNWTPTVTSSSGVV